MSRGRDCGLFIGRLSKNTRTRDVEEIFELYGRMSRCEVKYGAEMAYAFVDYEDRRDAEDALRYENGRDLLGSSIVVEWSKGTPRRPAASSNRDDLCYKCNRTGHWARDCPDERFDRYGGGGGGGGARRGSRYDSGGGGRRRSRSRSPYRRRRSRSRSRSRDRRRRRHSPSRSRSKSRSPRRSHRTRSRSRSGSKSPRGAENGQSD